MNLSCSIHSPYRPIATLTKPPAKTLTATFIAEAFNAYRFDVREDGEGGRRYIAEVSTSVAWENNASKWWAERGNREMAEYEARRTAEAFALQMAAVAFALQMEAAAFDEAAQ